MCAVVEILVVGELGGFGEVPDHDSRGVDLRNGVGSDLTLLLSVGGLSAGHW